MSSLSIAQEIEQPAVSVSISDLKRKLAALAQSAHTEKIPAVILLEGWGASGKGTLASNLISELDPRGYKVYSIAPATAEEARFAWMHRFWPKIPQYGQMAFFDRSWYTEVSAERMQGKAAGKLAQSRLKDIVDFERQICDDGYVLIKFFLSISQKEQRRRFKRLEAKDATGWRVTGADWRQNENYDKYDQVFHEMLDKTSLPGARWTIIDAKDEENVTRTALETLIAALKEALARKKTSAGTPYRIIGLPTFSSATTVPIQRLNQVDLSPYLEQKEYSAELKECQHRLSTLHYKLYKKKIPVILAYEGWDAAGKGGNIHRLAQGLDPRGYEVIPIAAPSQVEKEHPFLWRFWGSLPKDGHIAVFDRTWYGRVMVERIEGFCREDQWQRAYDEINKFEHQMHDWGAIVHKFWLQIDKNEQLARFQERQSNPVKMYKITPEDWRNRDKWDDYEIAVDEMLQKTNTAWAPWTIVESNNKYYARIKVLKTVIEAIEERL
jgi:AMP-polyphosphate phosphotransferase